MRIGLPKEIKDNEQKIVEIWGERELSEWRGQIKNSNHPQSNKVQHKKDPDIADCFPDYIVCIGHRPHINHLCGIELFIPLKEIGSEKYSYNCLRDIDDIEIYKGNHRGQCNHIAVWPADPGLGTKIEKENKKKR